MSDNKLVKISDEATILKLINGVKEAHIDMFIWKLIGSSKHLGKVRIESVRKQRKDFVILPAEGQGQVVQDLMASQSYIDIYVPDAAMLLRCNIRQTDAPVRYYLQFPDFVAQAERRKSLRINVHQNSDVQITFSKKLELVKVMTQTFNKACFDLSVGGLSFFVSKMESKFFETGDAIHAINIKTSAWSCVLPAEIVAIREIEPDEFNGLTYKVWRISCRFTEVDKATKQYLDQFILERIKDELHVING